MSLRDNKLLCRRGFNCRNWENLTLKCNGGKRVYLQMLSFFHTTTLTLFAHIRFLLRCSKTAFGAFTMVTLQTEHCSGSDWFLENTTKFDPIAANFSSQIRQMRMSSRLVWSFQLCVWVIPKSLTCGRHHSGWTCMTCFISHCATESNLTLPKFYSQTPLRWNKLAISALLQRSVKAMEEFASTIDSSLQHSDINMKS